MVRSDWPSLPVCHFPELFRCPPAGSEVSSGSVLEKAPAAAAAAAKLQMLWEAGKLTAGSAGRSLSTEADTPAALQTATAATPLLALTSKKVYVEPASAR